MKPEAIVYTSNTGFTRRYAQLLADKTGLPAVSLDDSQAKKLSGKGISDKKDHTPEEEYMLEMVSGDSDFVSEANLESVLEWLKSC